MSIYKGVDLQITTCRVVKYLSGFLNRLIMRCGSCAIEVREKYYPIFLQKRFYSGKTIDNNRLGESIPPQQSPLPTQLKHLQEEL